LSYQGQDDEAVQMQKEVLELRTELLGLRHPVTIHAMRNLAVHVWNQDKFDEALQMMAEVVELHTEVLGRDHPETIEVMNLHAKIKEQAHAKIKEQAKRSTRRKWSLWR